ncbi:MAG TPA: hypothetical protein VMV37_11960 [Gammaproteobacteria bacterium]|nr:hypothetical protein [Gammaproteobacteria bacterium]
MSESAQTAALRIASIALLAALCGCGQQPVDAKLVGTWESAITSPNGPYVVRFTTAANGAYRIDSASQATGEAETGAFTATGGKWRREKLTGGSDEGTYEVVSADTVLFKSKTDTMLWKRIPSALAAATAPLAASSGNAAPAGFDGSSSAGGGTQPSADLLATGPFGAPLPPSATFAAPQRPAGVDQLGSAAPGSAQQSPSTLGAGGSGSASGSAQVRATAPSTGAASGQTTNGPASGQTANGHPSVHDAATQGVANVQHAARKAAADTGAAASDAVNDAAVQTNKKVGQRITGFAANAGSKIKNFFTGHHASDDDKSSDATPAQQNGH